MSRPKAPAGAATLKMKRGRGDLDRDAPHRETVRALRVLQKRCELELARHRNATDVVLVDLCDMRPTLRDISKGVQGRIERRALLFQYRHGWRVLEGEALAVRCGAFPEDDDDRWRAADRSPVAHVRDLLRAGAFCVYETGTCARTLEGNLYVDNYDFGRRALSEDVARHEFWRVVRWPLQRWVARGVWAPGGARAKAMLAELPCDCV